ncbi:GNAT family N-acetyltransferase [Sphaerisporangium fuscum]|uniref:GNAT family N-acetyltransferase n=1 Tax=Sphaerisporangium fuscum TaxID=2835868 RepID=UPI001BDBFAD0|nr:GNAT family N-acetyltransferase [Sphaerisporangium fuscum]
MTRETTLPRGCAIEVLETIEEVDRLLPKRGTPLVPEQALRELDRRQLIRELNGLPTLYVVAVDGAGLAGLVPIYPTPGGFFESEQAAVLFGESDRFTWSSVSLIGSDGVTPNMMTARISLLPALLRVAWTVAGRYRPELISAPLLDEEQHAAVRSALPPGPARLACRDEAYFDLPYTSFSEYVAALPKQRRRQVRSQRRALLESGLTVRSVPPLEAVEAVLPLLAQVERKYGTTATEDEMRQYLTSTSIAMGAHCSMLVAFDGQAPVAFVTLWDAGPHWRTRAWGCDYGHPAVREQALYFNLTFFEPIERAIAAGVRRVYVGAEALEAKRRRGASVRRLRSLGWEGDIVAQR